MLDVPPLQPPPDPPPADQRQYVGYTQGMGGLQRPEYQTFLSSDQLLRLMPPGLQAAFANRHIGLPSQPPMGALGFTTLQPDGQSNVQVWRGAPDAGYSEPFIARHELTHAANAEMPQYQNEMFQNYPLLHQLTQGLNVNWSDPVHTFTGLADYAYDSPQRLPPALQSYFSPLTR